MRQRIKNSIKKTVRILKLTGYRYFQARQLEGKKIAYRINGITVPLQGRSVFDLMDEIILSDSYHLKTHAVAPRTIVDVGANVGYFTVHAATLFPECSVYAFEPSIENFKLLQANTAGFKNIHCFHSALSDYDGIGFVTDEPDNTWHKVLRDQHDPKGERCTTTTLQSFMKREGLQRIDILKLDCEGAEYEIMNGALDNIGEIVGEYHVLLQKEPEQLQRQLAQKNFYIREWYQFPSVHQKAAGHFWALNNSYL